jgi:hypothetical protein
LETISKVNNAIPVFLREEREEAIPDLARNGKALGEGKVFCGRFLHDYGRCPLQGASIDITPSPSSIYGLRNKMGNLIAFWRQVAD